MNVDQLETFAEGYLSGFFGTVGLALSLDPTYGTDKVAEFSDESMSLVEDYRAVVGGPIVGGGRIALLLKAEDAYTISAAVSEAELTAKSEIDEADLPQLTEALEACAGGGAGYFKETYDHAVEFESFEIGPLTLEVLEQFKAAGLGAVAEFTFDIPNVAHGKGVLLVSEVLEAAVAAEVDSAEAPTLTKDEVADILRDFDDAAGDQEGDARGHRNGAGAAGAPENLGRVLDIQLTATARLGRVEMPIQDILTLGPGSIVEVGHVVDEPVELLVNNKLIARGDVVVVDEKFGLRITEIISPAARIETLS